MKENTTKKSKKVRYKEILLIFKNDKVVLRDVKFDDMTTTDNSVTLFRNGKEVLNISSASKLTEVGITRR